jgi:ribosomal subunit interface protein
VLVKVTTDNHIQGSQDLTQTVENVVQHALKRFASRVTRVEAHLSDESSSSKSRANDKRCKLEARLAGLQPISVHHDGDTLKQAIDGAAEKLEKILDRTLGRLHDSQDRISASGEPT